MIKDQRYFFVLAAVFLSGLLAGGALVLFFSSVLFFPSKSEPPPDTSNLQELLQNTANKNIGVPPLTDAGLELSIERDKLDREVERIKSLAAKFGGTAIVASGDDKGTEVLAQISSCCANQFVEAVKHPEQEPVVEPKFDGKTSAFVEIRLTFRG
jgi:hypothetical protein